MPNQYTRVTYPIKTCARCGTQFKHRRRDTAGKYCSRVCSDAVDKNPPGLPRIPKTCPHCGASFMCLPWHSHVQHCSVKCSKRHEAKSVVGPAHPLWKPKIPMACEVCGTVRLVKPSLVSRYRACSRRCGTELGRRAMARGSSLEHIMADAFAVADMPAVAQFAIAFYTVDFAFPDERLVVECDGTYWHGRPDQQWRDRAKDTYLRNHGWQIIRLSEDDIRTNVPACVERVNAMLHDAHSFQGQPQDSGDGDPCPTRKIV